MLRAVAMKVFVNQRVYQKDENRDGKIWSDDGHAIRRGVLCFAFNINAAQSVLINLGEKSSVQPARIKFVNLNNGIQKGSTHKWTLTCQKELMSPPNFS